MENRNLLLEVIEETKLTRMEEVAIAINMVTDITIRRPIQSYKFIKRENGYTLYIKKEFGQYYHPISNDVYEKLILLGM